MSVPLSQSGGGSGGATPGGNSGDLQYNNAGALGGSTSVSAPGAIAFGTSGSNSAAAASAVSCTLTINVNDTVVVAVTSSTEKIIFVADDAGNPYVFAGMKVSNSGFIYIYFCVRAARAATTVFSSMGAAGASGMAILASTYTNVKKLGAAFVTGTITTSTAGTQTMSQTVNNSWIVTLFGFFAAAGTVTCSSQGTGTFRSQVSSVQASSIAGIALVDSTQASAGSLTNKTTASANSNWEDVSIELIPGTATVVRTSLT